MLWSILSCYEAVSGKSQGMLSLRCWEGLVYLRCVPTWIHCVVDSSKNNHNNNIESNLQVRTGSKSATTIPQGMTTHTHIQAARFSRFLDGSLAPAGASPFDDRLRRVAGY